MIARRDDRNAAAGRAAERVRRWIGPAMLLFALAWSAPAAEQAKSSAPAVYSQIRPIIARHCIHCHDAGEAEGKLVMETYALLMKGGEDGAVIVPGKANESALIRQVEHRDKPYMPPPKKKDRLSDGEIALLRSWIDAGAKGPAAGDDIAIALPKPRIAPAAAARRSIFALAYAPKLQLLAVAVLDRVELRSIKTRATVATLGPHRGNVNAIAFSSDGTRLFAASGQPAGSGAVTIWSMPEGKRLKQVDGHRDAIYAVAISPDGKTLATGGSDQKIILWSLPEAQPIKTLDGHRGAIFDLAFRPDGKVLASAGGDRTIKLWDVESAKCLDTRREPAGAQQAVLFNPDGTKLYAGGADRWVRIWKIGAAAAESGNSLLSATAAGEGSILRLAISTDGKRLVAAADDKTVQIWDAATMKLKRQLEAQSDWPTGLALAMDGKIVCVGRLDGTAAFYKMMTAERVEGSKPN